MLNNWKELVPKGKDKLSEESARAEIARLFEHYSVDLSEVNDSNESIADMILTRMMNAFRSGVLQLKNDDKGLSIIQTLANGQELTYREVTAADKVRLDSLSNEPTKKMHTLLGILSGVGIDAIGKLKAADLRIAEALAGFLLVLC